MRTAITKIIYDENTEEYLLLIPDGFMDQLGWGEGDEVYIDVQQGGLIITKNLDIYFNDNAEMFNKDAESWSRITTESAKVIFGEEE